MITSVSKLAGRKGGREGPLLDRIMCALRAEEELPAAAAASSKLAIHI